MIENNKLRNKLFNLFKGSFVIFVFFLLYLPIFLIIILSFNSNQTGDSFTSFTLTWYKDIFRVRTLYVSILNSLLVAMYSTLLATIMGVIASIVK